MASALGKTLLFLFIFQIYTCCALLEQGIFVQKLNEKFSETSISKSMYNGTKISVKLECKSEGDVKLSFTWYLLWSPCANEFQRLGLNASLITAVAKDDTMQANSEKLKMFIQQKSTRNTAQLCNSITHLLDESAAAKPVTRTTKATDTTQTSTIAATTVKTTTTSNTTTKKTKTKRAAPAEPKIVSTTTEKATKNNNEAIDFSAVTTVQQDGYHLFILDIVPESPDAKFNIEAYRYGDAYIRVITITTYMKGPYGYLSAFEWPLLPFYGTMCLVYLVYGIIWLVLLACNWRDLLRVQFWIGGVIFIGMLEKAVFFAEYESVNSTGNSVKGALVFAEIVSSLKRATARVLVIVVSLGFGIVKPRLGPMLHRVIGVGTLYFILATVESCIRVLNDDRQNKSVLISSIPLAVLDAALCWWIFTSLIQTTRTLRLRRNVVKLSLYRHFTNTLIFAVLASIAYMIWSIKQHKFANCLSDWRELWVDDAFWHILFCIILMVIMVLWRPTINNQRYAFSPLLDAAEEDESDDDVNPRNDALEAQKRSSKTKHVIREKAKSTDEDLKWIEENIPASVADTALPSLLDSDEEIMTTKYEMSKME